MMTDADDRTSHEIRTLAHEWLDAVPARDRATLDRIIADDFLMSGWQPDGRLANKQYYIADCLRPVEIQEGSYHFDEWKVRRYTDTAVVTCVLEIHAMVAGSPWGGEVRITDVWVRVGESWQVVTRHTSSIVRAQDGEGEGEHRTEGA